MAVHAEQEQYIDNSEVWEEFMGSDYAQQVLNQSANARRSTRTAAYEQFNAEETGGSNKLGEGPTQDEIAIAHPGGGTTTESVTGVRNERSQGNGFSPQYEIQTTAIKASDDGAHVETIVEQQDRDMDVATKQPTGLPNANKGETGGLKWAAQVRNHMKKIDAILAQAEGRRVVACKCTKCDVSCDEDGTCPECGEQGETNKQAVAKARTREAILRMTKLADELDTEGLTDEATELDRLIQIEVAAFNGKRKSVKAQLSDAASTDADDLGSSDLDQLVREILDEDAEVA